MNKIFLLLLLVAQGIFVSSADAASFEEAMKAYVGGDCKKAFRIWYMLEHDGNSEGRDGLGLIYLKGCKTDSDVDSLKDVERAIEILGQSQNPVATNALAEFYDLTPGTHKSDRLALKFYKKAHKRGVVKAAIGAYRILRNQGSRTPEYFEWQEKAARAGDPSAKCDAAFTRLKKGAEPAKDRLLRQHLKGCPPDRWKQALLRIAESFQKAGMYEDALEILDEIPGAETLSDRVQLDLQIRKGLILEKHAERQIDLAEVALENLGEIKARCQKAKQLFHEAKNLYKTAIANAALELPIDDLKKRLKEVNSQASKDSQWCDNKIATLTPDPITIELVRDQYGKGDYKKVLHNCKHLLKKHEAECRYFLGLMHLFGQGVEPDRSEALYHLEKSQNLNYQPAWLGLALYHLTEPKYAGLDKAEKLAKSFLLKKGASLNNRGHALYLLGQIEEERQDDPFRITERGGSLTKTYRKALKNYRESAKYNYWPAFSAIGELYHNRRIFSSKRYIRAFENFTVAAENGVPHAQYRLCQYYFEGKGTKTNINKSKIWCKKALENGIVEAAKFLN